MKILTGTLVGGILYMLLGWLVLGFLLTDFMSANMNQTAGRPGGVMVLWAVVLTNLATALLLNLILYWSGTKGIVGGLIKGAVFGFLYGSAVDLTFWSMTAMFNNIKPLIVDILVSTAIYSIVGLVIILIWGKGKVKVAETQTGR